jgi:hypothetical protein
MSASAIQKFAAFCRKSRLSKARELRAGDWKSCGGDGPLSAVRDQVVAEIERQKSLHTERATRGARTEYRPMARIRQQLAPRDKVRRLLAGARGLRFCGEASTGRFRLGDTLITIAQREDLDWDRYSKAWHRSYGPARTV